MTCHPLRMLGLACAAAALSLMSTGMALAQKTTLTSVGQQTGTLPNGNPGTATIYKDQNGDFHYHYHDTKTDTWGWGPARRGALVKTDGGRTMQNFSLSKPYTKPPVHLTTPSRAQNVYVRGGMYRSPK